MTMSYGEDKCLADLTSGETGYLERARRTTTAIHALEEYSRLWDLTDERLGKGNETTDCLVREYQTRKDLMQPDNPEDKKRLELMEASFMFSRVYPADVANALKGLTLFGHH